MWAKAPPEHRLLKTLVSPSWTRRSLRSNPLMVPSFFWIPHTDVSRIPYLRAEAVSGRRVEEGTSGDAGFPEEFYDEEWQARQREKTKEWHAYRAKEEEKENMKMEEYREIGSRLKGYPEEEVRQAKLLVSKFLKAGEDIEKEIEESADNGELTELVLLVIWNRLDLARKDEEKDAIKSLDLLYRRVETEILKRESTASMRLLNDLLNLHDGFNDDEWLKTCRKCMIDVFPDEDPFSILVPPGFDMEKHQGRIEIKPDNDDVLLRADFIREVDALLQEVRSEDQENSNQGSREGQDAESVANMLKRNERQRTIRQVEALLDLAITLKW